MKFGKAWQGPCVTMTCRRIFWPVARPLSMLYLPYGAGAWIGESSGNSHHNHHGWIDHRYCLYRVIDRLNWDSSITIDL